MIVVSIIFATFEKTHVITKFMTWIKNDDDLMSLNELKQYVNEFRIQRKSNDHIIDVITWWLKQRNKLSTFARMTLNILCISIMSSKTKRVFSSIKHLITNEKAFMHSNTIQTTKCVKYWMKMNIFIDVELTIMMSILTMNNNKIWLNRWVY